MKKKTKALSIQSIDTRRSNNQCVLAARGKAWTAALAQQASLSSAVLDSQRFSFLLCLSAAFLAALIHSCQSLLVFPLVPQCLCCQLTSRAAFSHHHLSPSLCHHRCLQRCSLRLLLASLDLVLKMKTICKALTTSERKKNIHEPFGLRMFLAELTTSHGVGRSRNTASTPTIKEKGIEIQKEMNG